VKQIPSRLTLALAATFLTFAMRAAAQGSGADQRGFVTVTVALAPTGTVLGSPEIRRPKVGSGKDVILLPPSGMTAEKLATILVGYSASVGVGNVNPAADASLRTRPALDAPALALSQGQTAHYSSLLDKLYGASPRDVPGIGKVQAINLKVLVPHR
jgi:hypothetical protein